MQDHISRKYFFDQAEEKTCVCVCAGEVTTMEVQLEWWI